MVEILHESQETAVCYSAVTRLWFSADSLSAVNGDGMKANQDGV